MTPLEGQIHIRLAGAGNPRTHINSQRAPGVSTLLHGKTITQALEIVPLLFNICGMAQARTACRAAETALRQAATPAVEQARDLLVLMEWAREHLARILIDWPRLFGEPANVRALPAIGALLAPLRNRLFPRNRAFSTQTPAASIPAEIPEVAHLETILKNEVYHMPAQQWASIDNIPALLDWSRKAPGVAANSVREIHDAGWAAQGRCRVAALPPIPAAAMQAILASDAANDFVRQPSWAAQPRETTSYTRQQRHPLVAALDAEFGNGLLTRWVARLVELAQLPGRMRRIMRQQATATTSTRESGPCAGLAQTEAARGRLYHFVETDGDRIRNYRILAPTEWNFHPRGVVAEALDHLSLPDLDERRFVAKLLVNAIDPCVACKVEYAHA